MVNRTEYINKFFNTLLERKFKRATAIDIVSFKMTYTFLYSIRIVTNQAKPSFKISFLDYSFF